MSNQLATIEQDIYSTRDSFAAVLTDRTLNFEREAGFALQAISASDYALKMAMGNRQSVVNAVTNIAAIGISLNPAKKQAYLVPRDNKICLDISYMGLMDLAMATGSIKWAKADLVYKSDIFALNGFDKPPSHTYNPFATDRGEIVGVYVVVKTADCDYLTQTMSVDEVNAIRDRSSAWRAYISSKKSCPWVTDFGEMAKKTCVKRAYKYWPKTERLEQAIHHLNTDGGEGIQMDNAPTDSRALVAEWSAKFRQCNTEEELRAMYREAQLAFKAAKCIPAFEDAKAVALEVADHLKQQPIEGEVA